MLREAADAWSRIADEYPSSEQTFRGVFFAGIALVRLGDWAGARTQFDRALVLGTEPDQLAAAYLWIGKCQEAEGDISAALDTWKQAQLADPFGHYSIRAEDLLIGRPLFSAPSSYTLDPDLTPYRLEAKPGCVRPSIYRWIPTWKARGYWHTIPASAAQKCGH